MSVFSTFPMSIKSFFWNVRGINDPNKHSPFNQWLLLNKPIFGALLETHIKKPQLPIVMPKICPGWSYLSNHLSDPDGRIVMIWRSPAVAIRLLNQSKQALTCEVEIVNSFKFIFTAIYASNENEERQDLWVDLLNTQLTYNLHDCPWVIGGDLNQIVHYAEHSSPSVNSFNAPMVSLRNVLTQLGVFDLRYSSPLHTWSNKNPSNPIAEKLDRLLVNHHWITTLPNSQAMFLPPNFSDHSPCLLDTFVPLPIAGTRPFKFFNYLTKHPSFMAILEDAWNQAGSYAWDLSSLCYKLRKIKGALKLLNRENFSCIQERVRQTNMLLQAVQLSLIHI